MSEVKQFNTSEIVISNKNFAESGSYDQQIYFHESYVVSGDIKAPKVYGSYDLIVLGNLEADEIEVQGKLTVTGKITAKVLNVEKSLICGEEVDSEIIVVSGNLQAESIYCTTLKCFGNVMVQTIVDVRKEIETQNILVAVEGVIGQGSMYIPQVITGEYFDFDGKAIGRIIDLGEGEYGGPSEAVMEETSLGDYAEKFKKKIDCELQRAGDMDEEHLKELIHKIAKIDNFRWCDWDDLMDKIIDLSYEDCISNFRDYLLIVFANNILPKEITSYETLMHVFMEMLKEAETKCEDMIYMAQNAGELSQSIKIIEDCEKLLPISKKDALDKVFQSIGIKYKTVEKYLGLKQ